MAEPIWSKWGAAFFRDWLNSPEVMTELPPEGSPPVTPKFVGALVGHLNSICGSDERRHTFLRYLFGVTSSKHLTAKQWVALYAFLAPKQNPDDSKWYVWAECAHMARKVIDTQQEIDRMVDEMLARQSLDPLTFP